MAEAVRTCAGDPQCWSPFIWFDMFLILFVVVNLLFAYQIWRGNKCFDGNLLYKWFILLLSVCMMAGMALLGVYWGYEPSGVMALVF